MLYESYDPPSVAIFDHRAINKTISRRPQDDVTYTKYS